MWRGSQGEARQGQRPTLPPEPRGPRSALPQRSPPTSCRSGPSGSRTAGQGRSPSPSRPGPLRASGASAGPEVARRQVRHQAAQCLKTGANLTSVCMAASGPRMDLETRLNAKLLGKSKLVGQGGARVIRDGEKGNDSKRKKRERNRDTAFQSEEEWRRRTRRRRRRNFGLPCRNRNLMNLKSCCCRFLLHLRPHCVFSFPSFYPCVSSYPFCAFCPSFPSDHHENNQSLVC